MFKCFYEGGFSQEDMEDHFTLTLFYLAQTYTKLGFKQKAAEHCGRTLQRQYLTGKFEINDFCHNLMGLSEYYQGSTSFAQAQYLLMLALKVLPVNRKKKMRATLQVSLGNLFGHVLEFCVGRIKAQKPVTAEDSEACNRSLLMFEGFDQPFPAMVLASDLEECKSIFRTANTQYKKALEVYVLDGFVTEHIDILHAQSRLYWNLSKLDKSRERVANMLIKRREMLEPLLTELNSKAFPATWQKILVEVS